MAGEASSHEPTYADLMAQAEREITGDAKVLSDALFGRQEFSGDRQVKRNEYLTFIKQVWLYGLNQHDGYIPPAEMRKRLHERHGPEGFLALAHQAFGLPQARYSVPAMNIADFDREVEERVREYTDEG